MRLCPHVAQKVCIFILTKRFGPRQLSLNGHGTVQWREFATLERARRKYFDEANRGVARRVAARRKIDHRVCFQRTHNGHWLVCHLKTCTQINWLQSCDFFKFFLKKAWDLATNNKQKDRSLVDSTAPRDINELEKRRRIHETANVRRSVETNAFVAQLECERFVWLRRARSSRFTHNLIEIENTHSHTHLHERTRCVTNATKHKRATNEKENKNHCDRF